MSLVADVKVFGGDDIGVINIERVSGEAEPDAINTYKYTIYEPENGRNIGWGHHKIVTEGYVTHRYGDGGMRLLLKALLDAERHL